MQCIFNMHKDVDLKIPLNLILRIFSLYPFLNLFIIDFDFNFFYLNNLNIV